MRQSPVLLTTQHCIKDKTLTARKTKPFPEAREALMKVIRTSFKDKIVTARAALRAIEGTSLEDQKRLFAILVGQVYTLTATESDESVSGGDARQWDEMSDELGPELAKLVAEVLNTNASLEETASRIWDRITLVEAGFRREVALSALLMPVNRLVPYAPLPSQPILLPLDCYPRIYDESLNK